MRAATILVVSSLCLLAPQSAALHAGPQAACTPPRVLLLPARRYANVDRTNPTWANWTPWVVRIVSRGPLRATVHMQGDGITWAFDAHGTFGCTAIDLRFDTHEPMSLQLDPATRRGRISSIDDTWTLY